MAFDQKLAARVRRVLGRRTDVAEKQMFGGLAFMVRGHMACGIVKDDLMVRVGVDGFEAALKRPGARPMDFTGKPSKGMLYVGPKGCKGTGLRKWVDLAVRHVEGLPAK